jgi:hypoxia up-regulated 1
VEEEEAEEIKEGDESEPQSEEEEDSEEVTEEATPDEEEATPTGEEPLPSSEEEEETLPMDETPPTQEDTPPTDEESQEGQQERGEEAQQQDSESTADSNATTSDSEAGQKEAEKKEKAPPIGRTVKLNLTAEFTVLDLPPPSSAEVDLSTAKLRSLQERDDEKVANEKAKNNLESYIFETQAWLEVDEVVAVSSEEQRENIRAAIREVYDWFEEEGYYSAETKVYKEKLRELKRASRSLLKRVEEAEKRPKVISQLVESINISFGFAAKLRNLTEELQIFTDVEMTALETLVNESMEWLTNAVAELKATPPEADPPVLSYQFEEQQRKLDREMMYLINKLKTHPPPKPKTPVNTTKAPLEEEEAGVGEGESEGESEEEGSEAASEGGSDEAEEVETAEPLELPPAEEDTPTEEDASALPTSATPRGEL